MPVRLTILCENTVGRPNGTIGELGFACYIETEQGSYLFDTGNGAGILRNSQILGRDLAAVRAVILSHGHYDHTGGLRDVLAMTGAVEVVAHPDIFRERYWIGEHERRFVGLPYPRPLLETLGARFCLETGFVCVAPGLHFTGEIPRLTPFETGDPHLMIPDGRGGFIPDPFRDDASLVLDTDRGLVVLLGCAHAGTVNILRHVLAQTGRDRIHAVIGGTHLAPAGDAQFAGTLQALRELRVEKIGVSHCTGLPRAAQLNTEFPGRFFFASVGSSLEI
jgi:7,8-dihydropterin-6-yl-methyl-4-(beta-D-ribofuranosyl)aminobenzene 5'-phosphate synthase